MKQARVNAITPAASVVLWFFILGPSIATADGEAPLEGRFWPVEHWQAIVLIAMVVVQGLLIVALLLKRRLCSEGRNTMAEGRVELLHASRLTVVGQLSASIAHEINQPLGAILSNADAAELMLAKADPDLDEVRLILADIRKDGLRASEVVRQVRTLVQKRKPKFIEFDLQVVAREILQLVAPIAESRGVTILTEFSSEAVHVRGDPVLLRQAMLNLLLNAMDALMDLPESQAKIKFSAALPQPGRVDVVVRDYGNGLPELQRDNLFSAFFTTKEHGLGLGLPIVRSIVEFHGGRIHAENHSDGGALFRFTIPAAYVAGEANHSAGEPV
ncbi:sensor histidine kinase [Marinobacter sediminicola]|uniref:sensor histidine kinase n=1 Tax=Marinobacter sediminicola TaxID=3072994 RepID=UPI002810BA6C|nr:ATP-binding protein [Marinobacter sp. F26243]